jgi:hypothetical protein
MKSISWASDALLGLGAVLVVCGVALWNIPLACIVAGVLLIALGALIAWINHAS